MEKRETEREGGISPKVVVSRLNNGLLVTTVRCDETTALIDMLFVVWTLRVQGTIDFVGAQIPPTGRVTFGVVLWHTETWPRSIFSTLFARGQERCGFWLPVYCSNLLLDMLLYCVLL